LIHQVFDGRAAVGARHLGVQVEPGPLDLVVVGVVGRKEVEHDPIAQRFEQALRLLVRVDAVDVDDSVDAPYVSVLGHDLPSEP